MSRTIMIKMKSIQIMEDDKNEMELITEGTLDYSKDMVRISYVDSEATGFEGSDTTIEIDSQNTATINRTGKSNSNLVLEMKKKHYCHYGTPYGDLMVGVYTHKVKNTLNESGGSLYMKYTIDINSSYVSDNEIFLEIQ